CSWKSLRGLRGLFTRLPSDHALHRGGERAPRPGPTRQFRPARFGDAVDLARALALRHLPLPDDQPVPFEGVQGGAERPLLQFQPVPAAPFDLVGDRIPVTRRVLQDRQRQGWGVPAEEFAVWLHRCLLSECWRHYILPANICQEEN